MAKYRLPQARQRLAVARKHLAEVKMAEKEEAVTSKFTYQKKPTESKTSRFQFQKEKPLERLQAEKEVKSAKRDVKQLKKAQRKQQRQNRIPRTRLQPLSQRQTAPLIKQPQQIKKP